MRTKPQKDADEFDRELFGLMDDARQRGDNGSAEWRKHTMTYGREAGCQKSQFDPSGETRGSSPALGHQPLTVSERKENTNARH